MQAELEENAGFVSIVSCSGQVMSICSSLRAIKQGPIMAGGKRVIDE